MTDSAEVTPITAGKQTARRLRRASEILAAAREVFLDKGFEKASVAEIAARVGVVEGLVYSYFPTKRALLEEVLRGMYVPLIRDVEAGFGRLKGVRSRMRFLIWRHLRVYVEEPGLSRIVLHEVRTGPEYFRSGLHDHQVEYTAFLMRTVREAIASGELAPTTDAEMVRSMVYGGIEHRMWATLFGRGTVDVEALADAYTDMVLGGIRAVAPPVDASPTSPPTAPPSSDLEARIARLECLLEAGARPEPPSRPRKRSQ